METELTNAADSDADQWDAVEKTHAARDARRFASHDDDRER